VNKIGILYYPARADSSALAERAERYLTSHSASYWLGAADDDGALIGAAPGLDAVVTLGGDGTIVRCVRVLAPLGVPLLGVNLGKLGFLTEVEPPDLEAALGRLLAGDYRVEERMLVRAELLHEGRVVFNSEAINDAVLGRGATTRTVHIAVEVDGNEVMTQTADAMIVATPTGSTAYNLSAGGPIVAPELECMVLTPVAPHISVAHAIVIPAERRLSLKLVKAQNANLTIDGQVDVAVNPGDEVVCTIGRNRGCFIHFCAEGDYYGTVLRRLRWPDPAGS